MYPITRGLSDLIEQDVVPSAYADKVLCYGLDDQSVVEVPMNATQLEALTTLRTVVGYLGERDQFAWWQSSFFAPTSRAFLAPVFGRTQALAQYAGVSRAAALVHD